MNNGHIFALVTSHSVNSSTIPNKLPAFVVRISPTIAYDGIFCMLAFIPAPCRSPHISHPKHPSPIALKHLLKPTTPPLQPPSSPSSSPYLSSSPSSSSANPPFPFSLFPSFPSAATFSSSIFVVRNILISSWSFVTE